MKTLYMTKGLPASGKTTWARELVASNPGSYKRVNKDDLRDMIDCGKWSKDNEKFVLHMRDQMVISALLAGKHVIVDDTNLAPKHEESLRALAKTNGAAFVVQDFTSVSVDECIRRDQGRDNYVGEEVIRGMYDKFLAPPPPAPPLVNPALPTCVICDIDGTIAKMNGRSPYDYSQVHTDVPHKPIVELVSMLSESTQIVFVSGRKAECRESTIAWLDQHISLPATVLHMRQDGDDRDDRIVKEEIYRREIEGKYNVLFVLDDRDRVVRKWRELGLTCLQVAPGDF
jgi:predicted kinase